MGATGPACPLCGAAHEGPTTTPPVTVPPAPIEQSDAEAIERPVPTATSTMPPPPPASAPPPPTPRPDPYAQINNPLNSNWGQPVAAELPPVAPVPPRSSDRRGRAARTAVAVAVIVAVVAVAWFARDQVTSVFDDVVDRVTGTDSAALGTGAVREANDAFLEWEAQNVDEIRELSDSIRGDVDLTTSAAFWQQDVSVVRPVAANILGTLEAMLSRVGTAPDSQLKSDVTTVYFKLVGSYQFMLSGLDGGPQSDFSEAERLGSAAAADVARFSEKYGDSTQLFRL